MNERGCFNKNLFTKSGGRPELACRPRSRGKNLSSYHNCPLKCVDWALIESGCGWCNNTGAAHGCFGPNPPPRFPPEATSFLQEVLTQDPHSPPARFSALITGFPGLVIEEWKNKYMLTQRGLPWLPNPEQQTPSHSPDRLACFIHSSGLFQHLMIYFVFLFPCLLAISPQVMKALRGQGLYRAHCLYPMPQQ